MGHHWLVFLFRPPSWPSLNPSNHWGSLFLSDEEAARFSKMCFPTTRCWARVKACLVISLHKTKWLTVESSMLMRYSLEFVWLSEHWTVRTFSQEQHVVCVCIHVWSCWRVLIFYCPLLTPSERTLQILLWIPHTETGVESCALWSRMMLESEMR